MSRKSRKKARYRKKRKKMIAERAVKRLQGALSYDWEWRSVTIGKT